MKQPVDHILRPQLPWRESPGITECGLDASKISTLTREQYFDRLKEMGQQRCSLFTCMTCADTARRWGRWEDDPRKALEREIAWETGYRRGKKEIKLLDELTAISALIGAHPEEFESLVAEHKQRREWLIKKDEHQRARRQI